MLNKVSKKAIIAEMSDKARSFARELDKTFGVVEVRINGVRWIKI